MRIVFRFLTLNNLGWMAGVNRQWGKLVHNTIRQMQDVRLTWNLGAASFHHLCQSRMLPSLTRLRLSERAYIDQLSFAPLLHCPTLRILELTPFLPSCRPLSETQMEELRALPRLDVFTCSSLSSSQLPRLLRLPHALQWKELSQSRSTDMQQPMLRLSWEGAAALELLPSLTTLRLWSDCSLDFLPTLKQLSTLQLYSDRMLESQTLHAALRECTALTCLRLNNRPLNTDQFADVFRCMPELSSVELEFCRELKSLRCFQNVPTLTSLELFTMPFRDMPNTMPLDEIEHLHGLLRLRVLGLENLFDEDLSASRRALYEPPSALFPELVKFTYQFAYSQEVMDYHNRAMQPRPPPAVRRVGDRFDATAVVLVKRTLRRFKPSTSRSLTEWTRFYGCRLTC